MIEAAKLKKSRALYISIVVASIILLVIYRVVEFGLLNGMSSEEVFYTLFGSYFSQGHNTKFYFSY